MQHSVAHTVTLAAVAGILHQQNFRVPVLFPGIAEQLIERRPDAYAFVVGGNDKTVGQEAIRGFWRAAPRDGDYATWRRLSSMPKNSDTNSSSQSPLRASASMVTAACSWLRAGL